MPLRPGSHDHAQGACRGTESQISDDRSGRDHDARKVRTIRELDPDFAVHIMENSSSLSDLGTSNTGLPVAP